MMHPTIRTKWHKLRPLLEKDEVYFTAPPDGLAQAAEKFGYQPDLVKLLLDVGDELPKFVIDPELMKLSNDDEYTKSLLDMKRAGVMRLPFPAMIVELPIPTWAKQHPRINTHTCVLIRDLSHRQTFPWEGEEVLGTPKGLPEGVLQFYGYPMRYETDKDGEYLVIAPSMQYLGLTEKDGVPTLGISASAVSVFTKGPEENADVGKLVEATYKKDAAESWCAMFCALLLMRTIGVEKQVIDVDRLNRRRTLSNKPPIPKHTYVHIGKVYRSVGGGQMVAEGYEPRKSPRPHWRRGHNRHVRFGAGKNQIRLKYFEPILVAFRDDDPAVKPKIPEYMVKD